MVGRSSEASVRWRGREDLALLRGSKSGKRCAR